MIICARERCIPGFKMLFFGVSPQHAHTPEFDDLAEGDFTFAMDFQIQERDYSLLGVQIDHGFLSYRL